ncbi:MAG TPA: hypothetical protein VLV76_10435 [Candidatus Acidoferrum sp.]|nr:hypothetical protein [Candidatus Acidoferrum sp.]
MKLADINDILKLRSTLAWTLVTTEWSDPQDELIAVTVFEKLRDVMKAELGHAPASTTWTDQDLQDARDLVQRHLKEDVNGSCLFRSFKSRRGATYVIRLECSPETHVGVIVFRRGRLMKQEVVRAYPVLREYYRLTKRD